MLLKDTSLLTNRRLLKETSLLPQIRPLIDKSPAINKRLLNETSLAAKTRPLIDKSPAINKRLLNETSPDTFNLAFIETSLPINNRVFIETSPSTFNLPKSIMEISPEKVEFPETSKTLLLLRFIKFGKYTYCSLLEPFCETAVLFMLELKEVSMLAITNELLSGMYIVFKLRFVFVMMSLIPFVFKNAGVIVFQFTADGPFVV